MKNAAVRAVNSLVFSPEETKYLKAIFRWTESHLPSDDEAEQRRRDEEEKRKHQLQQKPAGELHILVIGAKGAGKTALLTRFASGTFGNDPALPDPLYEHGCRRPLELDEPDDFVPSPPGTSGTAGTATTATTSTRNPLKQTQGNPQTYMLNALEMPSKNLHSNPLLAQALSITEGAALLFSVRDEASLRLAQGLAEFMREHFAPPDAAELAGSMTATATPNRHHPSRGRPYPILLVGTKADTLPPPNPNAYTHLPSPFVSPTQTTRKISYSQGCRAAAKIPMPNTPVPTRYMETSALTGEGVDEVFAVLGREVLRARRMVREQRERMRQLSSAAVERDGEGLEEGRDGIGGRMWWFARWLRRRGPKRPSRKRSANEAVVLQSL
ncbi:hypothetical protein VTJ49DRAFT_6454 [Mycothermus thermophilus]|uniref:Uncharacterized protein n=1 Tax=Humicola insolens TaxID=85995 RepID=A0ABR3V1A4_HUMIN